MTSSIQRFTTQLVTNARLEAIGSQEAGVSSMFPKDVVHFSLCSQAITTELDQKWDSQDTKYCTHGMSALWLENKCAMSPSCPLCLLLFFPIFVYLIGK